MICLKKTVNITGRGIDLKENTMKREKGVVCALLCMSMFLLAGCKTQSYDLSEEDQGKIADYAAHVVTKYNGRQEEGYLKVSREEIEQEEEDASKTGEEGEKKQEKDKKKEDSGKKQADTSEKKPKEETVSLTKALKLEDGLKASYVNYEVTSSYVEEDYFSLTAMEGKTYLILHINLESKGQETDCDMLSKNLNFRVVINGDKQVGAQTSILLNDLGSYQGKIAADGTQDCVLLFETESDAVEKIDSLQLKVLDGTSSGTVNLQ